jgi:outer membrane protein assembly factor BamB
MESTGNLHKCGTARNVARPAAAFFCSLLIALSAAQVARSEPGAPESRGTPRPAAEQAAQGKHAAGVIPSPEAGWPQWRGRWRDGISDETGLLESWPEGGPKLVWRVQGLGRGWSSPIITGGAIYITGDVGEDLIIFAFNLDGKPLWQAKNGPAWKASWPGARACCAASEGRLYHMNAHGRAACLDQKTGRELWAVDTLERFEAKNITWAIANCLLVDGPRVIVTPGGRKAMMAALDKKTGETVWASEPIADDKTGYSSPILFEYAGRRHIVNFSGRHAFGADADTGRLLWTVPCKNQYDVNVSNPAYADGAVFIVAPDGPDAALYRLRPEAGGEKVEQAWAADLDTLTGGVVVVDGCIYGAGYRKFKGWRCLDWQTGRTKWESRDVDSGSAIWADGRLYILAESGPMVLAKPTPAGLEVCGRFDFVPSAKKRDVWPHPVLLDGRLYLRYHDTLACYDVRAK